MDKLYIKDGFMLRNVAGNNIVVAVGKASKEFNGMISLNDSGAFLFKSLKDVHTKDELVNLMLNEYDVTKDVAESDIDKFLKVLKDNGILK